MIINNNLQAIRSVYAKAAVANTRNAAVTDNRIQEDDEIVLSPTAKSFSTRLQALRNQDGDVRMDKVKYFEEKIANGTYKIDANALAGKILDCRL